MLLISLSAVLFCREYSGYMDKRLSECEAFLELVRHIRREISCFLKPIPEICRSFRGEEPSVAELVRRVFEGEDLVSAYKTVGSDLAVDRSDRDTIEKFFSSLGGGYLEESIRLADAAEERLNLSYEKLKEECPKQKKLAASLTACAVVGLIILLI